MVLLVVFIITAPLLSPQALKINLPKTQAVTSNDRLLPIHLIVDAQGGFEMDGANISDQALADLLKARAVDPQFQLQVEADKTVPYG